MLHNRLAKLREERENGENGFTLIELLVVVVIIGILIAIAIPLYLNYTKNGHDSAAESDLRNAVTTLQSCDTSTGTYPASATVTNAAVNTPCTGQKITVSDGTTLMWFQQGSGASYTAFAANSKGNTTVYCFDSTKGGAVQTSTSVTAIASATSSSVCP